MFAADTTLLISQDWDIHVAFQNLQRAVDISPNRLMLEKFQLIQPKKKPKRFL